MKILSNLWQKIIDFCKDILAPEDFKIQNLINLPEETMKEVLPKSPVYLKNVSVLFDYQNKIVRLIVKSIKYKNNQNLRKRIAKYFYEEIVEFLSESAIFYEKPPLLIPMPMTKKEKSERGFNQCEELCKEIKKLARENLETSFNSLKKIRETERQNKLSRQKRLDNVKGSMAADSSAVRGRNCLVIDDVYTTGASFEEARRALSAAGPRSIFGFFIAH